VREDLLRPGHGRHGSHAPLHLVRHHGVAVEAGGAQALDAPVADGGGIDVVQRMGEFLPVERQPRPTFVGELAEARHLIGGIVELLDGAVLQRGALEQQVDPVDVDIFRAGAGRPRPPPCAQNRRGRARRR
jgi:hypothetical protein